MRKNSRQSNLRLAWICFVAIIVAAVMLGNAVALYGVKKNRVISGKEAFEEESQADDGELDMSKYSKEYLIRKI